jgi:uncharacterized protein YkwD
MKHILITCLALSLIAPIGTSATSSLAYAQSGKILLQVEENGEAWYVYPKNFQRYYFGRPADAFSIMRSLGLGITNADLAKIPVEGDFSQGDSALRKRLSGSILLQVEEHGEAWYVYPGNLKRYYLGRPADAFAIMRSLGLGITNQDLDTITSYGSVTDTTTVSSTNTTNTTDTTTETTTTTTDTTTSSTIPSFDDAKFVSDGTWIAGDGSFQKGNVPADVNYAVINEWFLNRINQERTSRGQFSIVSDQRMVDTASVWAEQMYLQGEITHTRKPVNMMARVWVWNNFHIEYGEDWGWLYENIGGGSYDAMGGDINQSIIDSLDSLVDYFISEESYNGIHFQTIMHDNLTHVGVGFYFEGDDKSGKLWTVMHYGALAGQIPVINKTW